MTDDPTRSLSVLADIEDRLFPTLRLDVWERTIYYHLLRRTLDTDTNTVQIALAPAARATGMSEAKIRTAIRSMATKGCVRIEDRGKNGHVVRLLLPHEIERVRVDALAEVPLCIEDIDFYEDRRYVGAILRREDDACFYCTRIVTAETVALDHVIAAVEGGGNSHTNIVATCHECNSLKQEKSAEDYIRLLYRKGVLSQDGLSARLARLALLRAGELAINVDEP